MIDPNFTVSQLALRDDELSQLRRHIAKLEAANAELVGALEGLLRVCEDTVVEDFPEYEIAQVEFASAKQAKGEA